MMFRLATLLTAAFADLPEGAHPVVVVGPMLAQSLEARVSGGLCDTAGSFKTCWDQNTTQSLKELLNPCFLHVMEPAGWDSKSKTTIAKKGVEVQPLGGVDNTKFDGIFFGGMNVGESSFGDDNIVARLHQKGYQIGKSLLAHPFDWRLGVVDWQLVSFPALKQATEEAVERTGKAAVLTGVSLAGPYTHSFLRWVKKQDASWTDRNVHAFVPVDGVFGGVSMSLAAVLTSAVSTYLPPSDVSCPECVPNRPAPTPPSGLLDRLLQWLLKTSLEQLDKVLQPMVNKWPVLYYVSPQVDYSTQPPTDPEVVTLALGESDTKRTFKASELPDLFRQLGRAQEADIMSAALEWSTTADPEVPVHCVITSNVQTYEYLSMSESAPQDLAVRLGDGDGVASLNSLNVCGRWQSTKKVYSLPGVTHALSIVEEHAMNVIESVALGNDAWQHWTSPDYTETTKIARAAPETLLKRPENASMILV